MRQIDHRVALAAFREWRVGFGNRGFDQIVDLAAIEHGRRFESDEATLVAGPEQETVWVRERDA